MIIAVANAVRTHPEASAFIGITTLVPIWIVVYLSYVIELLAAAMIVSTIPLIIIGYAAKYIEVDIT